MTEIGIDFNKREAIKKIVRDNVAASNVMLSRILLWSAAALLVFWSLFALGVLDDLGLVLDSFLLLLSLIIAGTSVYCIARKGYGQAFQYILLALFGLFLLWMDVISGYKSRLLLALPVVVSTRYYNKKLLCTVSGLTVLYLLISILVNAFLYQDSGLLDLNTVTIKGFFTADGLLQDSIIALHPNKWMLLRNGLIVAFFPNCVFLAIITYSCLRLLRHNLLYLVRIDELARKETAQAAEIADMRTKIVLSQVKPHFIYNTLTSIASLCTFDPPRAKDLTIDFATYLRTNLDSLSDDSVPLCTFSDELAHVKCYLNIEQVRFDDRLKVEYDIAAEEFMVPVLSVQPLVENAVKHGICKRVEGGTLRLSTREVEGGWTLTVSDDGVGFDVNQVPQDGRAHVGMANVRRRLELYGCTLSVESTPGVGTTSTIFIPREARKP